MGEQQSLFPIDPVDPAEAERPDDYAARLAAALAFNDAYLSIFYRIKLPEILASRDTVRIRLFLDWWIAHPSDTFYDGYTRPALLLAEREWVWIDRILLLPELIDAIEVEDKYRQAVRWHIGLVVKLILAKRA